MFCGIFIEPVILAFDLSAAARAEGKKADETLSVVQLSGLRVDVGLKGFRGKFTDATFSEPCD